MAVAVVGVDIIDLVVGVVGGGGDVPGEGVAREKQRERDNPGRVGLGPAGAVSGP